MRSDVLLVSTIGALLFLASATQGLRCYQCKPCDPSKENIAVDCPKRCYEFKGTESGSPLVVRGCSASITDPGAPPVPSSGCKEYESPGEKIKGKLCVCKTDNCNLNLNSPGPMNRGYALSYQWITLAASSLMAVSVHHIVR